MKNTLSFLITLSIAIVAGALQADTLELADGTLLEGDFVGSSNDIVMFNTGDGIEAFPEKEVVGIYLSAGVNTASANAARQAPMYLTVPSGTRLVIRLSDSIDSKRHSAGHRFRGQLEGSLVVNGVTVAPRGTFVHGRVAQAKQAGNVRGSSELTIEFTDLMIDDQLFEIFTSGLSAKTENEAGKTLRRTARASTVGRLAGGKKGARTGLKVGAAASVLTAGASINVPAGTIVETRLAQELRIQQ